MKRLVLSTLILMALQASASAQSSFSIQASSYFPTGEMKRDLPYDWGGGFTLEYVQRITPTISAGVRYGFTLQNREQQMWALAEPLGTRNVTWQYQMDHFFGFIRLKPQVKGPIRPYFDLVRGTTTLRSETSYILTEAEGAMDHTEEECPDNSMPLERRKDQANSWGLGAGFEFIINPDLLLDFTITSHRGGPIEALTPLVNEYTESTPVYDMNYRTGRLEYMTINFTIKASLASLLRDSEESNKN